MKLKKWLNDNFDSGLVVGICTATPNVYLTAFLMSGYAAVLDSTLVYRQGRQIVEDEYEETPADGYDAIKAYLTERARYLAQIIEYFNSEYVAMDNYNQVEHEETTFDGGQRKRTDNMDYKQYTDTTGYGARSITNSKGEQIDTYDPKGLKEETTTDKSTTTTSVAPFDSDSFHNKEKVEVEGAQSGGGFKTTKTSTAGSAGAATSTSGARSDSTSETARSDTLQHGAHKDTFDRTEDAYKDETERDLTRSGNIGIRTTAEIFGLDESWWWNFKPMQKLAREIAGILCEGVEAL